MGTAFFSLKHFSHLSHSCIKTCPKSVQPVFSNILTKMTSIFFSHFENVSVCDRKKQHGHAFPSVSCCFVYLFYLTLILITFLLMHVKRLTKNLFVLATGLAEQLTYMVFH